MRVPDFRAGADTLRWIRQSGLSDGNAGKVNLWRWLTDRSYRHWHRVGTWARRSAVEFLYRPYEPRFAKGRET